MEVIRNTDEFYKELVREMDRISKESIDRPVYDMFLEQKRSGKVLSHHDINRKLLTQLCVDELCGDEAIASLFNTEVYVVEALRKLYKIDSTVALIAHTCTKTDRLMSSLDSKMKN